jgi:hypothetical protein
MKRQMNFRLSEKVIELLEYYVEHTDCPTKTAAVGKMIANFSKYEQLVEEQKRIIVDLTDFKKKITQLGERGALKAYANLMSEEEKQFWASL